MRIAFICLLVAVASVATAEQPKPLDAPVRPDGNAITRACRTRSNNICNKELQVEYTQKDYPADVLSNLAFLCVEEEMERCLGRPLGLRVKE